MNDTKTNIPEERIYRVRILGTGAADPTKELGNGVTVTRTAEGVYKFSFDANPGAFVQVGGYIFGDTTPGDVKGHTLTRDTYTSPSGSTDGYVEVSVWDSTFAADDLDATEYLDISFVFAWSSVVD